MHAFVRVIRYTMLYKAFAKDKCKLQYTTLLCNYIKSSFKLYRKKYD